MSRPLRAFLAAVALTSCLALRSAAAETADKVWQIKQGWWAKLNDRFSRWLERLQSDFQESSRRAGEGAQFVKKSAEHEEELEKAVKTASEK